MKKILIFLLVFCSLKGFSQFPVSQSLGSPTTQVYSRGGLGTDSGLIFRRNYADTSTANLGSYIKNIPNIVISIGDSLWKRNNAATRWDKVSSSVLVENTTIFDIVLDSTGNQNNRLLFSRNGKISSSPRLLVDSANNKIVIGGANVSVGGPNTKLWVQGNTNITGSVTGGTIVKSGGTATQFLMADGSTTNTSAYQGALSLTTTGSSGASTLIGNTLNIPNYAGGGGAAKAYTPLLVRNDSVYQRFNVLTYGADNTGATDATVAIQAATDACIAAGGGDVFFPNGTYKLSGALVTSRNGVNPNAQITIPPISYDNKTRAHIRYVGESKPNYLNSLLYRDSPVVNTGVILKSTITGSGSVPAVFGGIGDSVLTGTYFTYHVTSFENLKILVPANAGGTGPTLTGINGKRISSVIVENCVVSIDTSMYRDTIPQNDVAGIITTQGGGESFSAVRNSLVIGFRYGIVAGEHAVLDNAQAWNCYAGFVFTPNALPVYGSKIETHWCKNGILIPNTTMLGITPGACRFKIDLFEDEVYVLNTRWFNNAYTVLDTGNRANGVLYHNVSLGAVDGSLIGNQSYLQYNGADFKATPLTNPGAFRSAVSVSTNSGTAGNIAFTKGNGTIPVAYKNIAVNDAGITNSGSGDISILNDNGSGGFNISTGASATSNLLINSQGSFTINARTTTIATFNNPSGGNSSVFFNSASNTNVNTVYQNNGANVWYVGNTGAGAANNFRLFNSDANGNSQRLSLSQAGILTLNAYGAGTATFDGSGNISSASDRRIKHGITDFKAGLAEVLRLRPRNFIYNADATETIMSGFIAQEVQEVIPGAVHKGNDKLGTLSLETNAILAALVNGMQEQQKQIEELKKEIKELKKK